MLISGVGESTIVTINMNGNLQVTHGCMSSRSLRIYLVIMGLGFLLQKILVLKLGLGL